MALNWLDTSVFLIFFLIVIAFSMFKSRVERNEEDYFLAGRGLVWWLIGFSLIAANISTEQFVGMNGSAAGNVGLAIASYDWMAAASLVIVALYFLPKFLRSGIYTIPEYLEYRYNAATRALMALLAMAVYIGVTISAVLYSGGLTIHTIFGIDLTKAVWLIGITALIYTVWGGLKAVAWADLFLGSALLAGGACVAVIGLDAAGGIGNFIDVNQDKLHMILPADHPELPWTALLFGLWIPNLYYWSLNQYIAQRALAARSLKDSQLGLMFAAVIQIFLPLIIVIPGIIAWQLYAPELSATTDASFPLLIRKLMPAGLRGFIFAAISGAVISSLASMVNSASTIFTMDIFKRHLCKSASSRSLVLTGRISTVICIVIGCLIAPQLGDPRFRGIFHYIQDFQGFISPGILAAFVFGLFVKRAPGLSGMLALLLNPVIYGILHLDAFDHINFLNKMAITFSVIVLVMAAVTMLKPLDKPVSLPVRKDFDVATQPVVYWIGIAVLAACGLLYLLFW
jgi:SSS family solute:Na+ symporter